MRCKVELSEKLVSEGVSPYSENIGVRKQRMLAALHCRAVLQVQTNLQTPEIHVEICDEGCTLAVPF